MGQRPANSKSLGAGYADVQTNAMLASFPPIAGNYSASTEGKSTTLCYLRIVDIFSLYLVLWGWCKCCGQKTASSLFNAAQILRAHLEVRRLFDCSYSVKKGFLEGACYNIRLPKR